MDLMEYRLFRNRDKVPKNWKGAVEKFPWVMWKKAKWDIPTTVDEAVGRLVESIEKNVGG